MKPVSDKHWTATVNTKEPNKKPTGARNLQRLLSDRSLLVGLGCLASLGLLSKGIVWAQTETPTIEQTAPGAADLQPLFEAPVPVQPAPMAESAPTPEVAREPRYQEPDPQPEYATEPPAVAAPGTSEYYLPEPALIPLPEPTAQSPEPPFEAPVNPANAYNDQTDYSAGATNSYEAPTNIEFSDRSTECPGGGSACAPAAISEPVTADAGGGNYNPQTPIAPDSYIATPPSGNVPRNVPGHVPESVPGNVSGNVAGNGGGNVSDTLGQAVEKIGSQLWGAGTRQPKSVNGDAAYSPNQGYSPDSGYSPHPGYSAEAGYYANAAYSGNSGGGTSDPGASMGLGPIEVGPISVSSGSNTGFAYYNLTPRPAGKAGNGNTSLLFPLSIAAAITSPFGWRTHPVMGYGRFHTGTDLGAELGTPVLAAYAGQVAIADWLGGYGLTVVLNHSKQSQETLYGHLSELFVKPGEWVKQGETIGRVGSTGMSTGPHLHFEIRQMTDRGWVAIDPGSQLEFALAKMIGTLETAKLPPQMPEILPAKNLKGFKDLENDLPQLPPLPVGMDIEVHNLQPPFPELVKAEVSQPKEQQVSQPKTQKTQKTQQQASR
ncbi:peptidoglycan DD-metalloendopeptidase family protein [Microcoleus sp. CAWBG640]|uniref:M23 family metallopeptidase n=1 Tax=Microcoleus sp. CAWBG640 TaxID=2841653 RepID=UPI00312B7F19